MVQHDLATLLGIAMEYGRISERALECLVDRLGDSLGDGRLVAEHRCPALTELGFPRGALGGLQAVLAVHLHEHAVLLHRGEEAGQLLPELRAAGHQVIAEKVGKMLGLGAHAEIGAVLARELVDQEDERARPAAERAVRLALL